MADTARVKEVKPGRPREAARPSFRGKLTGRVFAGR